MAPLMQNMCSIYTDVRSRCQLDGSERMHTCTNTFTRHAYIFFIDASVASLFREMFYFIAQHQNAASNATKKGSPRVSTRTMKGPSKNYSVGRTCQRILSSLSSSLSLLFYNLFTRLVLITRESYDFGTFVIRMRIKWHDEKQVFARCERN